ncbi:MAG: N-acetylmuramoyl-L-alanine amidase [Campylobacterota bacterium]|nr:N-acetylmuramoyl-L-alanine amidase [Campylobacterota bacterium]
MPIFTVNNGILEGAQQIPHLEYKNKDITPKYIAIHYTAGGNLDGSINYLRKIEYSYQILIDRDGRVVQGTPLTKRASHAGVSNWKGLDSMNNYAIGISLANFGFLNKYGNQYYNLNSHNNLITPKFDQDDVVEGKHWNGTTGSRVKGWEKYTPSQYIALKEVCKALLDAYPSIIDVVGHEEIAMGRKPDPGMAFDWSELYPLFKNRLNDLGSKFSVNVASNDLLHVRKGPGGSWGKIDSLPRGTVVHIRSFSYKYVRGKAVKSKWASIAKEGTMKHYGFAHAGYLQKI